MGDPQALLMHGWFAVPVEPGPRWVWYLIIAATFALAYWSRNNDRWPFR